MTAGAVEELEALRILEECLEALGAPGELDALELAELPARMLAGYWHEGQWSALYAFTSSGHVDGPGMRHELEDGLDGAVRLLELAEEDRAARQALREAEAEAEAAGRRARAVRSRRQRPRP
jgi:nucleotide-binding universal stress UspA family protein